MEAKLGWNSRQRDIMCTGIDVCKGLEAAWEVEDVEEERQRQIKTGSLIPNQGVSS